MEGRAGAGALGPRLAGRLTAELILRSPQYMSCVKDYEIDLRGAERLFAASPQQQLSILRTLLLLVRLADMPHQMQVTSSLQ